MAGSSGLRGGWHVFRLPGKGLAEDPHWERALEFQAWILLRDHQEGPDRLRMYVRRLQELAVNHPYPNRLYALIDKLVSSYPQHLERYRSPG